MDWAPWKNDCGVDRSGLKDGWAQRWQGVGKSCQAEVAMDVCSRRHRNQKDGHGIKSGAESGEEETTVQPPLMGTRRRHDVSDVGDRGGCTTRYGRSRRMATAIMAAMLIGCRIGEADNPGHGLLDPAIMKLKTITMPNKEDQRPKYANPLQQGFRGGKGPGFDKEFAPRRKSDRPQEEVQMRIDSSNVT